MTSPWAVVVEGSELQRIEAERARKRMSGGGKGKGNFNSNDLGQSLDAVAVEERDSRAPQGKSGCCQ